jgi:CheY-like chemotaxis protein
MLGDIKRILIIDDAVEKRAYMRELLEARGYEITEADGGLAGVQKGEANPPDLILLDLRMPGIGGLEACRMLRENDKTRDVPIMFVTAEVSTPEDKAKGLRVGADDYITYPLQIEELTERIRSIQRRGKRKLKRAAGLTGPITQPPRMLASPAPAPLSAQAPIAALPTSPAAAPEREPMLSVPACIVGMICEPKTTFTATQQGGMLAAVLIVIAGPLINSFGILTSAAPTASAWIASVLFGGGGQLLGCFAIAALFSMATPFVAERKVSWKAIFTLVALAFVPTIIGATASLLYTVYGAYVAPFDCAPLSSGIDLWVPHAALGRFGVVSRIGIFDIWGALLLSVGVVTNFDIKRRRGLIVVAAIAAFLIVGTVTRY